MGRRYANLAERLLANSAVNEAHWWLGAPCWDWLGRLNAHGYPQINVWVPGCAQHRPKTMRAHRLAFVELGGGQLRKRQEVNHLCNRRCCINPAHLEAVSRRKNEQYKRWLQQNALLQQPSKEEFSREPGEDDEPIPAEPLCDEHTPIEELYEQS